jgi:dipeptidyl aminopeptidase/acylaminoacyl peptidase
VADARGLSQPDHPERISVNAAGDAAAFVVGPGTEGARETTGLWYGPLDGKPSKIADIVPDTNLAFAPVSDTSVGGNAFAMAVQDEAGSRLIIADPEVPPAGWREYRLPAFAERVAWTAAGPVVLAADPGADAASLTSGKPLADGDSDPVVARDGVGWRRLWIIDTATQALVPASPDGLAIWEFAPVPGGGTVVVASSDPTEAGWYHCVLALLDASGQQVRVLRESPWQLSSPAVSPDGRVVAYVEGWSSDRGLLAGDVRLARLDDGPDDSAAARGEAIDVDVTWLSWAGDGRLWLAGWRHLGTAWGWADEVSKTGVISAADLLVRAEEASCLNSRWHPEVVPLADGSVLTARSTPVQPPEVVRLRHDSDPEQWTALNEGLVGSRQMVVSEQLWKAPDGTTIEALLAEPAGAGPARPRPLVVDIHGGPSLAWHHSWDLTWAELLTGEGYAVLMANPRGSAGRGQQFGRANLGDPAGAEFADVLAGVEHCAAAGLADPGRVGAMGASYGGYLTAWAVAGGQTFRCGVVIAGMSDLVSCWGTANNAPFYDYLLEGRPDERGGLYLDRSPAARISATSLPALILHGQEDRCVPVGQAQELHAGLRRSGVPVEFVSYPREGHQVSEAAHVADQRERVLRWFATYLEGSV